MTNEALFFGDKKFISAKRAGELTGYTSDYIGQISRAGKVNSRMVGRVRFVEEESLLHYYRHVASSDETTPNVATSGRLISPLSRRSMTVLAVTIMLIGGLVAYGKNPEVAHAVYSRFVQNSIGETYRSAVTSILRTGRYLTTTTYAFADATTEGVQTLAHTVRQSGDALRDTTNAFVDNSFASVAKLGAGVQPVFVFVDDTTNAFGNELARGLAIIPVSVRDVAQISREAFSESFEFATLWSESLSDEFAHVGAQLASPLSTLSADAGNAFVVRVGDALIATNADVTREVSQSTQQLVDVFVDAHRFVADTAYAFGQNVGRGFIALGKLPQTIVDESSSFASRNSFVAETREALRASGRLFARATVALFDTSVQQPAPQLVHATYRTNTREQLDAFAFVPSVSLAAANSALGSWWNTVSGGAYDFAQFVAGFFAPSDTVIVNGGATVILPITSSVDSGEVLAGVTPDDDTLGAVVGVVDTHRLSAAVGTVADKVWDTTIDTTSDILAALIVFFSEDEVIIIKKPRAVTVESSEGTTRVVLNNDGRSSTHTTTSDTNTQTTLVTPSAPIVISPDGVSWPGLAVAIDGLRNELMPLIQRGWITPHASSHSSGGGDGDVTSDQLDDYLALTGGTLTGALIGTGGTFSGALAAATLTVTGSTTLNGVEYLFPSADGATGEVLTTDSNGVLSWTAVSSGATTTDGLPEGLTNLYYTTTRVADYISASTTIAHATPTNGNVLLGDGTNWLSVATSSLGISGGGGTGDVVGPASATDNAIARYDSTTGKLIQNSGVTLSDVSSGSYGMAVDDVGGNLLLQVSKDSDSGYVQIERNGLSSRYFRFSPSIGEAESHSTFKILAGGGGGTADIHLIGGQVIIRNLAGGFAANVGLKQLTTGVLGVTDGSSGGGALYANYFNATSTTATSTFAGFVIAQKGLEAWGQTAGGQAASHVQIGLGATADGDNATYGTVAIGHNATAGGATPNGAVAIGAVSSATGEYSTAIGIDAGAAGTSAVGIGTSVRATGNNSISILGSGTTGANAISVGTASGATASNSIAIGGTATAAHAQAIALGGFAVTTAVNQMVIGGTAAGGWGINDLVVGGGVTDTAPDATVTIETTGGSGTNVAGSALRFAGGKGTGNAAGGALIFSTSDAGSTGTTLQSLTEKMRLTAVGNLGIGTTTPAYKLAVAGSALFTGALYDNSYSAGSNGMVLQSTGTGFNWVATSSLGIGGGGASGWTDAGSYLYTTSGESAMADYFTATSTTATSTFAGDIARNILYTDASNYERFVLGGVAGTSLNLTAETAGTGADNLNVVVKPAGTGGFHVGTIAGGTTGMLSVRNYADTNPIVTVGTAAAPYNIGLGYLGYPEAGTALRIAFDGSSASTLVEIDGDQGGTSAGGDLLLKLIGADDQSLDLTQWTSSSGALLASVNASGAISSNYFTATSTTATSTFAGRIIGQNGLEAWGQTTGGFASSQVQIGLEASADGTSGALGGGSVAIGHFASVTGSNIGGTAVGGYARAVDRGTALGRGSYANGDGTLAVGDLSSSSGTQGSLALGYASGVTGVGSISIGSNATNNYNESICLGGYCSTSANNQLVIGGVNSTWAISDVYIGNLPVNASPVSTKINATGGEGTDIAGASLTLAGGKATGSATGGALIFSTSDAGSSGTTLQSLTEKMRITAAGYVGIGSSTPSTKLVVSGGVTAEYFNATSTTATSTFAGGLSAASSLYVLQGGNVGIGTASPSASLHVSGNTSIGTSLTRFTNAGQGDFADYVVSSATGVGHDILNIYQGSTRKWRLGYLDTSVSGSAGYFRIYSDASSVTPLLITPAGSMIVNTTAVANTKLALFASADLSGAYGLGVQSSQFRLHVDSSASRFSFLDAPAGNEIFTIKGTGNVGIGSTTPASRLVVKGVAGTTNIFEIASSTDSNILTVTGTGRVGIGTNVPTQLFDIETNENANSVFLLRNASSTGASSAAVIKAQADVAVTQFIAHGSGRTVSRYGITLGGYSEIAPSAGNGLIIGTINETPLIFGTSGTVNTTEAMRITTGNFVGIGTTTPAWLLSVQSTSDTNVFAVTDTDGQCLHNPESGAETVTCSSDQKLKNNIRATAKGLEWLSDFNIRDYEVKASGDTVTGVIAQELQQTHPELVSDQFGTLMVEQPNVWVLIRAIQELGIKIETLVTRFAAAVVTFTHVVADKMTTKELCLEDVCITKTELQELLDNANTPAVVGSSPSDSTTPSDTGTTTDATSSPQTDPATTTQPADIPPIETATSTDPVPPTDPVVETPPIEPQPVDPIVEPTPAPEPAPDSTSSPQASSPQADPAPEPAPAETPSEPTL